MAGVGANRLPEGRSFLAVTDCPDVVNDLLGPLAFLLTPVTITMGELWEEYWHAEGQHKRPTYCRDLVLYSKNFCDAYADRDVSSFDHRSLTKAMTAVWPDAANSSWNSAKRTLSPLFSYAVKHDYLKVSPVSKVQGRTHSKAETTVYDVQQVQRLIAECDDRSRLYWSLAVFAGVRPLELTRLDPKDVSINHRRIVIKSSVSKTKTPRVIDMSDNLASLLEPLL